MRPDKDAWRVPDAVHEELLNWARWCWMGDWPHPLPSSQCGSLESQYRAPPAWNPADPPERPYIRPNDGRAKVVQRIYDGLSTEAKQVLKAEYPCRHERGTRSAMATKLGLPLRTYEALLMSSVRRVEAAFEVCP